MEQLGTVESKLRNLIDLQIDLANPTSPKIDLDQLTRDCVTTTVRAMSYCSRIEAKNLPEDEWGGFWRIDFMHPDRWFVTQDSREPDGNFGDQWISIGPYTYHNAGLWFQDDTLDRDDFNSSSLVDVYLDIIDKEIPDEIFDLPNKDHSYIILRYIPPLPNQYGNAWLKNINEFQEGSGVYLWINSKNYYLEKADIIGKNLLIEGKDGQLSQSFYCFVGLSNTPCCQSGQNANISGPRFAP
jgi:hypothetical protein